MVIKLDMLRCFVAVADAGNLAEAANQLGRSPSAVSMMLKQFESHLGQSLFETDRKARLSPVGVFALEHARRGLGQFDQSIKAIDLFAQAGTGSVRLAAVPSVAGTLLPKVLEAFLHKHPNVQIDLRDMDSTSILHELQHENIDLGIATAAPTAPGVRRLPLLKDTFGLVCSLDHPLACSDEPLEWQPLTQARFIANSLCALIQAPAFQSILGTANLSVQNTVSLLSMVRANLGVTVLPEMAVKLDPTGLHFRPLLDQSTERRVDILFREGQISPAADILGRHIQKAAQELQSSA